MMLVWLLLILVLCAVLTVASYIERVYAEAGRLLSREFQENIEIYEEQVEPRLGKDSRRVATAFGLLAQMATAAIALLLERALIHAASTAMEVLQLAVAVVLVLLAFNRVLPFLLFSRTRGEWLVPLTPALKLLLWIISPVTLALNFCLSVAALAEKHEVAQPETPQEAVEALIEAGEEEGILEEGDRELIHSVVEFGDKVAREVMTPRPNLFAVPETTTIAAFHELWQGRPHSRVPVYRESLDEIVGILFTPDLLQVADQDAEAQTVASLLRPAYFVPETKRSTDLLRELQRQKSHMAVVIDEYGGVAGVVTVEDLIEEIVGELHDEREQVADAVQFADGSYIVSGTLDLGRLDDLFGFRPEESAEVETSTVGGFLTERLGHIPRAGETLEEGGLRFEVLEGTDRKVEKLRIVRTVPSTAAAEPSKDQTRRVTA